MDAVKERMDLSGYEVTLTKNPVSTWTWEAHTPDDEWLFCEGAWMDKDRAKKDALASIERHLQTEKLDGNALRDSLP